jgi:hypothetical protein
VRVGRAAIDEDAIRQIEASHPDVEFDWPQILKGQGIPSPEQPEAPPRKGRERAPRPGQRSPDRRTSVDRPGRPPAPASDLSAIPQEVPEPEDGTLEAELPVSDEPATPAEARLGSAGLARLRARYAELLTRISDRVPEPERQEELKAIAERLNPDAWITDADVTAGLDAYEQTYELVRSSLPPRRKPADPV